MSVYFHWYDGFIGAMLYWFLGIMMYLPYGLLFYYIINRFLRVREKWWARLALTVTGTFSASMIIYIADAFNILALFPFFAAALWKCTSSSRSARASMIILMYPMIMAFNAVMDNNTLSFHDEAWSYPLFHIGCRLLFWGLLALLARRFIPELEGDGRPILSARQWLLLDLLALTPVAAVFVLVIYPSYQRMSDAEVNLFRIAAMFILPVVVLSSLGLLYAVTVLSRHEALRRQETMWGMQALYYRNLEQEQTQVRRLRHDMANHLQALSGLMGEPDKARAYLDSLVEMPGLTVSRRFCDNPTVNAVLASKAALMEEKAIHGDIAVALPSSLPLSDTDLCALFANALDNAIEACERLEEPGERLIRVRARADRGFLMAQITNRMDRASPASLETTKADKAHHGYGLSILRELTERAGGTFAIEQRPGTFELIVTIPI